ncbi:MAG: hypothetical protein DMG01_22045 [Acidobacteria bacterium]|nr:MAG: hypothetical protein DMG01_22045 [Acidobacteriota bacterium]
MLTSALAAASSSPMETVLHDVRYALRTFARMRGVAAVAVVTLALGIAATTTMFSVAYAALLRPLPFTAVDRLVILYISRSTPREGTVRLRWSKPVIDIVGAVAPYAFESIATFTSTNISLSGGEQTPEQVDGETVSPDYFDTLRVSPIAGRVFAGEDDAVVLISERLWRRRFNADPSIVGRNIRLNDDPLTVAGVLPASFTGLNGKSDVWIPRALAPRLIYSDYLTTPQHFINVVARLRAGTTLGQANAALATIGPSLADADGPRDARWSAMALPIGDARIDPTLRRSVFVLLAAASCVLLIACVNVAGLLLARARTREREMAVRLAIGSSRGRLVRQLLTEALLLAVASAAFGVLLAEWGVEVFARTSPAIIASARNDYGVFAPFAAPALDVRVLLFTLLITVATTIACGLTPALQASRPTLVPALKEDVRTGGGRHRALGGLVIAEVALAVLLLTASGLLLESFAGMQQLRAGFAPDGVLTFWVRPPNSRYAPADGPAIIERVLARIEQVPGVVSAAVNRATPFMGGARTTVFFPDRPVDPRTAPSVGRHYVSAAYFRTLGVPLVAGRLLTAADRKGRPPVTVINETAARRFWPGENPIGKHVWFGSATGFTDPSNPVEVVGIVGDVPYDGVASGSAFSAFHPDFYTSYLQFSYPDTIVLVKTRGDTAAIVPALRSAVASVDQSMPIFDLQTLDERVSVALARPRFNASVVALFAGAALLLAAIGVYGMLSYSVSSRLREIGIRLALGADAARVLRLVLADGLRLTAAGGGIGLAAALVAWRLLRGWLIGVADLDPRLLVFVAAAMALVASAAALLPARRASAVDPAIVLRNL